MFGNIQDFQPIADNIIAKGLKEPYDWDEYARCFFETAEKLGQTAEVAHGEGDTDKARDYYLLVSPPTTCLNALSCSKNPNLYTFLSLPNKK